MSNQNIVIIGSGMAGYTLAREFRKLDQETPLILVTADDGAMYSKPMLSNALAQNKTAEALVQKPAATAASDLGIEVRANSRVEEIDRSAKSLTIHSGDITSILPYGKLVMAVGANPRPYSLAGSENVPVAAVNSLTDYRNWRTSLKNGDRILLIGAGLIGVEFANDLSLAGHKVTLVEPAPAPLGRLLPRELGDLLSEALTETGIDVFCSTTVESLKSGDSGRLAILSDGQQVGFDKVLSAIGLQANTALASAAGLTVGQGIIVDDELRTSDPDIFAIGDCAQTRAGMLPYVLPLMAEARTLAQTLAGNVTSLSLPALPVVVKTPALPIVICPPLPGATGNWVIEGTGRDRRATFTAPDGRHLGFTLTGTFTKERQILARTMPALLAA